jgi:hypothetical protein
MNRPPQPADTWHAEHQRTCGGTYTKISSPAPKEHKARTKDKTNSKGDLGKSIGPNLNQKDIRTYFDARNTKREPPPISPNKSPKSQSTQDAVDLPHALDSEESKWKSYGKGYRLGGESLCNTNSSKAEHPLKIEGSSDITSDGEKSTLTPAPSKKFKKEEPLPDIIVLDDEPEKPIMTECPICKVKMLQQVLNSHLDKCLENQCTPDSVESKDVSPSTRNPPHSNIEQVLCPICHQLVAYTQVNSHIDECLGPG